MKIYAKKIVSVYARVNDDSWDYRVWPSGQVEMWSVDDENVEGHWILMNETDSRYDEIRQAGLDVLEQK